MKKVHLFIIWVLMFSFSFSNNEICKTKKIDKDVMKKSIDMHEKIIDYLEAEDIKLAFIGRKGLKNSYVEYTHAGVLWKNEANEWVITDLLQPCNSKSPVVYDEKLIEFFIYSAPSEMKILVPSIDTQEKMRDVLLYDDLEVFLGHKFNLLSYIWSTKYQNCTQFIIEIYAYMKSDRTVQTREEAQQWLVENNFIPEKIKMSYIVQTVARIHKDVALDDHKNRKYIEIASVDTIFDFIKRLEPESKIEHFKGEL